MSRTPLSNPASLLLVSVRAFLYALALLLTFHSLRGASSTRGLLKDPETGGISALRLQMLIVTAIASVSYAAAIRQASNHLPPVDARLLALVSGSNGLVLLKQAFSKLIGTLRSNHQPRTEDKP